MSKLALWVNRRLVADDRGAPAPPGAGWARRWLQADGSELTLVTRGDVVDLVTKVGADVYATPVEPRVAASAAWWLLRWWVGAVWCGAKLRLWEWSLGKLLDARGRR